MRGKYSSPKAKQGWAPRPKTRLQLTKLAGVSEDEGLAPPMRKSPAKLLVKGGKGIKEASATAESTQAPVPLIPERRTKSASKDRQAVPRPGVGDEAEAGANNNQGAGKQKGTTSGAVRSPKPRVQLIAKNKMGVEQQKETVVPSKGVGKGREKAVLVGSQKPHENILAQKTQVVPNKGKEKVVSVRSQKPHEDILTEKTQGVEKSKETAEDPRMEKKKGKKKPGSEKPKETGMSSEAIESQIIHEHSAVEKMQRCVRVGYLSSKDEDTAEDSSDQLEEYEKRRPAKLTEKVKKEEKESDLVEIYDSSDEEEARQDQEEAEDEGEEEESGEEEEKSICEEGEEEEDEGGDEEGADDKEEDGEKAEEEGEKVTERKLMKGMGVPRMMKIGRMMGRVAGMMGRGTRKGIVQKARMNVMKGT
ncbi:hypothetical protein L7F22_016183 [Adiantum nelumboides]|nr:hypothetical protein [Adiantum nelumboides]